MDYHSYIQSPAWQLAKQRFKQSKLYRDGACYVCCNKGIERHIHHLTYERLGCERLNDLMVLCAVCHGAIHKREGWHKAATKMRNKWSKHANREHLWSVRHTDSKLYAIHVAKFFGVIGHKFTVRSLSRHL